MWTLTLEKVYLFVFETPFRRSPGNRGTGPVAQEVFLLLLTRRGFSSASGGLRVVGSVNRRGHRKWKYHVLESHDRKVGVGPPTTYHSLESIQLNGHGTSLGPVS